MTARPFDAVVVGAGPAGATAALLLARGGAKVLLVDRSSFPRDKACGDLIAPRAARVLDRLGVPMTGALRVGDMRLVGPSGRRVDLPWPASDDFPSHALSMPRSAFDAGLQAAAKEAGADFAATSATGLFGDGGRIEGVETSDGRRFSCSYVVGADGALSRVAAAAGLVSAQHVLWGFALRFYLDLEIDRPTIVYWEPTRRRAFPGYGWLFPGPGGEANVGLGISVGAHRASAARVSRLFPAFVEALEHVGLLEPGRTPELHGRKGGWLKMGSSGTVPGRAGVLLVGDAAGLVNPLSGEGISQAMLSGQAAAEAILTGGDPATEYRHFVGRSFGRFYTAGTCLQTFMVSRPRVLSAYTRILTAHGVRRVLAPGWAMYWNDLIEGSRPGPSRAIAISFRRAGELAASGVRGRPA